MKPQPPRNPRGAWVGSPTFETRIHAGERLVLYGPGRRLRELDRRQAGPEGDRAHEEAVADHRATTAPGRRRLLEADRTHVASIHKHFTGRLSNREQATLAAMDQAPNTQRPLKRTARGDG